MRQYWKDDELNTLRSMYGQYAIRDIAEKLGRTEKSIRMTAHRLKLSEDVHWTDEEKQIVVSLYPLETKKNILEKLPNRNWESIRAFASKLKVKRLNSLVTNPNWDKFFDVIDTKEKAWLLGYFCADGHLGKCDNTIVFDSIDKALLQIVKDITECPQTIVTQKLRIEGYNKSISYRLKISSARVHNAIAQMGFDNNKSHTAHMPIVKNELLSHWVRGLCDGDGSITRVKDGGKYALCLHLNGTEKLITSLHSQLPIQGSLKPQQGVHRITYSYRKATQLCDWMYQNSDNLRLERKYQRYVDSIHQVGFYSPLTNGYIGGG